MIKPYKLQATSYKLSISHGFTLLEVLIGAAIITASLVATLSIFQQLLKINRENMMNTKAEFLLAEGLEGARIWRDQSWLNLSNLMVGTNYRYAWASDKWATTTTVTLLDGGFDRTIQTAAVARDSSSHDIVSSGGANDSDTRLVTVTVAWRATVGAGTTTRSVSVYLTNLFGD